MLFILSSWNPVSEYPVKKTCLGIDLITVKQLGRKILWPSVNIKDLQGWITFCIRILYNRPQKAPDTKLICKTKIAQVCCV